MVSGWLSFAKHFSISIDGIEFLLPKRQRWIRVGVAMASGGLENCDKEEEREKDGRKESGVQAFSFVTFKSCLHFIVGCNFQPQAEEVRMNGKN